jgi:hypothetical protein
MSVSWVIPLISEPQADVDAVAVEAVDPCHELRQGVQRGRDPMYASRRPSSRSARAPAAWPGNLLLVCFWTPHSLLDQLRSCTGVCSCGTATERPVMSLPRLCLLRDGIFSHIARRRSMRPILKVSRGRPEHSPRRANRHHPLLGRQITKAPYPAAGCNRDLFMR